MLAHHRMARRLTNSCACADVLGNAYLTQFFSHSHDPAHLTQAMKAYGRADETGMSRNPDLHFNRGMVYKFQEE